MQPAGGTPALMRRLRQPAGPGRALQLFERIFERNIELWVSIAALVTVLVVLSFFAGRL